MKKPRIADPHVPVCIHTLGQPLTTQLHTEGYMAYCALMVMIENPKIRYWLKEHDPKALEQACNACGIEFATLDEQRPVQHEYSDKISVNGVATPLCKHCGNLFSHPSHR